MSYGQWATGERGWLTLRLSCGLLLGLDVGSGAVFSFSPCCEASWRSTREPPGETYCSSCRKRYPDLQVYASTLPGNLITWLDPFVSPLEAVLIASEAWDAIQRVRSAVLELPVMIDFDVQRILQEEMKN